MIHPWQQAAWQHIDTLTQHHSIPHALLLTAAPGSASETFAQALAQRLLCEQQQTCGQCRACLWCAAQSHPDFHHIHPDEKGRSIKIDQIRPLQHALAQAPHHHRHVVIIEPADKLLTGAANSLLKLLEEPPSPTVFLLVTAHSSRLLATIRSRCQTIALGEPTREQTMAYLHDHDVDATQAALLADWLPQSPQLALAYAQANVLETWQTISEQLPALARQQIDPLQVAQQLQALDIPIAVSLLAHWIDQSIRQHMLSTHAQQAIPLSRLWWFRDHCTQAQQALQAQQAFNGQLLLEALCCHWFNVME